MEGLFVLGIIVGGLALFDILALRFGVDSRDGFADPRRPVSDLTT
jgi:hypothetical protein